MRPMLFVFPDEWQACARRLCFDLESPERDQLARFGEGSGVGISALMAGQAGLIMELGCEAVGGPESGSVWRRLRGACVAAGRPRTIQGHAVRRR